MKKRLKHRRRRRPCLELLEDRRLLTSGWLNPGQPLDINNDLFVSPVDALIVINDINQRGPRELDARAEAVAPFFDSNGDNHISPGDVLAIIDGLNVPKPFVAARLSNDTAAGGTTNSDRITMDATVSGAITLFGGFGALEASVNNPSPGAFQDISPSVVNKRFVLDKDQLDELHGRTLSDETIVLYLRAVNSQGQGGEAMSFEFSLDRSPPQVTSAVVVTQHPQATNLRVFFDEAIDDSVLAAPNFVVTHVGGPNDGQQVSIESVRQISDDAAEIEFSQVLADESDYELSVDSAISDLAGNPFGEQPASHLFAPESFTMMDVLPANGEELVSTTRAIRIDLSEAVDGSTVTSNSIEVIANGQIVAGTLNLNSSGRTVRFLPDQPWPGSTAIRLRIVGDELRALDGDRLDADGDGAAGGQLTTDFHTIPMTRIPETNVFGFVRDSYTGQPIAGATIRVDALPEANATTDENGRFELVNMPTPEFFVHVDGTTATSVPAGFVYPNVGKPFHSVPGQTVQLEMDGQPFDIFLPPMAVSDVVPLSSNAPTDVGIGEAGKAELADMFPQVAASTWDLLQVTIGPDTAVDDAGNAATEAAIIPVPPDRIPAPLPLNLDPELVISIQAIGATNFDIPAPIQFPNLEGLAAGEKALIYSFDHDAGEWRVVGTGTVSEDESTVVSDGGVIQAPGWHFAIPGSPGTVIPIFPPLCTTLEAGILLSGSFQPLTVGIDFEAMIGDLNVDLAPPILVDEIPLPDFPDDGVPPQDTFTWRMGERVVADANGRIAIPNTSEYANPGAFAVFLDGTQYRMSDGGVPDSIAFTIADTGGGPVLGEGGIPIVPTEVPGSPGQFTASLPQASYNVTLTATRGAAVEQVMRSIVVRDIVVVAIGDSASSGEGNPEVTRTNLKPAQWATVDDAYPNLAERNRQHGVSHRSSWAASAQLALQMEQQDPHTSVTFVFVSASGGEISEGALNPYTGISNEEGHDDNKPMSPQLDQVDAIVQDRNIDAMTISLGINDIGFANVVAGLLFADPQDPDLNNQQYQDALGFLKQSVDTGDPAALDSFVNTVFPDLTSILPQFAIDLLTDHAFDKTTVGFNNLIDNTNPEMDDYDDLNTRLGTLRGGRPNNIYITEYPNPLTEFVDGSAELSTEIANDVVPGWVEELVFETELEIGGEEVTWAVDNVLTPLNAAAAQAASNFGWQYVSGIADAFLGHGYNGDEPFDANGNPINQETARWIATATDSAKAQGPLLTIAGGLITDPLNSNTLTTKGTLHPNRLGHRAIKEQLYAQVSLDLSLSPNAGGTVSFSVDNGTIPEAGGVATLEASLSAPLGKDVLLDFEFSGSAEEAVDYTASNAQILIPAGQLIGTISFAALDDLLAEPGRAEMIHVSLTRVTLGSRATDREANVATVSIEDNEAQQASGESILDNPLTFSKSINIPKSPIEFEEEFSFQFPNPLGIPIPEFRYKVAELEAKARIEGNGDLDATIAGNEGEREVRVDGHIDAELDASASIEVSGPICSLPLVGDFLCDEYSVEIDLGDTTIDLDNETFDLPIDSPIDFYGEVLAMATIFGESTFNGMAELFVRCADPIFPPGLIFFDNIVQLLSFRSSSNNLSQEANAAATTENTVDIPLSSSLGFGGDDTVYYRYFVNGIEIAGTSQPDAGFTTTLPGESDFELYIYSPSTNKSLAVAGRSGPSGQVDSINLPVATFGGVDTDRDGLPDVGEIAIGTNPGKNDTDDDGILDSSEVENGLDPLGGRAFPTGVIASLPLMGPANEVTVVGSVSNSQPQTTFLATGSHGLAVVDVSQFINPIVLGQLDLPGDATDVGVDSRLDRAVVAANQGGLHFVDVSDPMLPELVSTVNVAARRVEVVDGVAYAAVGTELRSYSVLTGELIDVLALPGSAITDIAREGPLAYTMDTARRLQVVDLGGFAMQARGSLLVPGSGGKLFAGGGIVYAAAATDGVGGFATADVSDPDQPRLLGPTQAPVESAPRTDVVANGSGRAILVGTADRQTGDPALLQLVDLDGLDPPDHLYRTAPRIELPAPPRDVTLGGGIAFVAGGAAGLHVVNYLPFDNQLDAPTVTIDEMAIRDRDPDAAGLQVQEGSRVRIPTEASDDVQVRNVELLVDGVVVQNDLAFPFDLTVPVPLLADGSQTATVEVRATDTGGNTRTSTALPLNIVPDTFAPSILQLNLEEGAFRGRSFRTIRIAFDDFMNADTLNSDNIQLVDQQDPGTSRVPYDIQFRNDGREVLLTYPPLTPSDYRLTIDTAAVTDRAGNAIGGDSFTRNFTIVDGTAVWLRDQSGFWNDPLNWLNGHIPTVDDDVFIPPLSPDVRITVPNGGIDVRSFFFGGNFQIFGGEWRITETVQAAGTFTLDGGTIVGATILQGVNGNDVAITGNVTLKDVDLQANTQVSESPTIDLVNSTNKGVITVGEGSSVGMGGEFTLAQLGNLQAADRLVQLTGTLNLQTNTLTTGSGLGNWQLAGGAILGGTVNGDSGGDALEFNGNLNNLLSGVTVNADLHLDNGDDVRIFNGLTLNGTATFEGNAEWYFVRPDEHADPYDQLLSGNGEVIFNRFSTGADNYLNVDDNVTLTIGADMTLRGGNLQAIRRGRSGVDDVASVVNRGTVSADLADLNEPLILNPSQWQNLGTINVAAGAMLQLGGTFRRPDLGSFNATDGVVGLIGTLDLSGATLTTGGSLGNWQLAGGAIIGGTVNGDSGGDALEFNSNLNNLLSGVTVNADLHLDNGDDVRIFNGLTLNGTATFEGNAEWYFVRPDEHADPYDQLLSGNGEVIFNRFSTGADNYLNVDDNVTLTIGADMTLRGGNLQAIRRGRSGVDDVASVVNRGTVSADLADLNEPLILNPSQWQNLGTINVAAGAMLQLGGTFRRPDLGSFNATDGVVGLIGTLDLSGATLTTGGSLGNWLLAGGAILGGTVNGAGGGDALEFNSNLNNLLSGVTVNADLHLDNGDDVRIFNGLTLNGTATFEGNAEWYFVRPDEHADPYDQLVSGNGEVIFNRVSTGADNYLNVDDNVTLTIGADMTLRGGNLQVIRRGRSGVDDVASVVNRGTVSADLADLNEPLILNPSRWQNLGTINVAAGAMLQLGGTFRRPDLGTFNATDGVVGLIGTLDLSGATLTTGGSLGNWLLAGGAILNGTVNGAGAGDALEFNGNLNNLLSGVTVNADLHLDNGDDVRIFNGLTLNGTATLEGNAEWYFVRPDEHADPYDQLLDGNGEVIFNRVSTGADNYLNVDDNVTLTIGADMTLRGGNLQVIRRGRSGVDDVASVVNRGTVSADLADLNEPLILNPSQWQNLGTINLAAGAMLQLGGTFTRPDLGTFNATDGVVGLIGTLDLSGATLTTGGSLGNWLLAGGAILGGTVNGAGGGDALEFNSNFNNLLSGVTVNADLHLDNGDDVRIFDGLTLNGTATLEGNAEWYFVRPDAHADPYDQLLAGNGEVIFNRVSTGADNYLNVDDNVTLTIGADMTLRGGNVQVIRRELAGIANVATVINDGVITADLSGETFRIDVPSFVNNGTASEEDGGILVIVT